MSITNQPFDQFKIEKLKHFLEEMATKNAARPYEIFVDNLKVVPKTEDASQFDSYENFMDEDTAKLRILIYNSNQSPRNDQYCFVIKAPRQDTDGNLGEIDSIIREKLKERDREYEIKELQKSLDETQEELEDTEARVKELEAELRQYKEGKEKRSVHMGEAAGSLLMYILKQPEVARRIPGGQALAGLLTGDFPAPGEQAPEPAPASNTSFSKKPATGELDEKERACITFIRNLYDSFEQEEVDLIMQVLIEFSNDHDKLYTVTELLNIKNVQE